MIGINTPQLHIENQGDIW